MKKLFYILIFGLILSQPTFASDKDTVVNLLKNTINSAILILEKQDLKPEEKNKQITELIMPVINFRLMGKLSLGKKHWARMSGKQQDIFMDLFIKRLDESYLKELPFYTDEKIIYKPCPQPKKNKIYVPTVIVSKTSETSVIYKFYLSKNGWLIYDIEVEGISIISSYRSQFDSILKKAGIEELFIKLEQPEEK